ncbi:transposase [Streptomyces mirabilis]|uniref:transposase n=1 Tax=Streptomyces mirabilis TaxID=68239 RepID=UPI001999D1F9|nr:transposase [Streptomyces mirabilis]GHD48954.1 hypothetical protein GCM10010317_027130 [Streptomyces mirabilis]
MRAEGRAVDDELLAQISPAHSENVNFFGTINVEVDTELPKLDPAGYRPLRPPGLSPRWDAARREEEDEDGGEDEWKWAVFDMTPGLAQAIGVSPLSVGPGTPMRGTGLMARPVRLGRRSTARVLPHLTACDAPVDAPLLLPGSASQAG